MGKIRIFFLDNYDGTLKFVKLICSEVLLVYCILHHFRLPAWSLKQAGKFLGLKFVVNGKENIVQNSPCIVLINHQSIIDMLGVIRPIDSQKFSLYHAVIIDN